MEKTVFLERIDGLMVEQVERDREYSMYSRHFHESYELYFLLAGERYYFIDKETFLVKAGMAVLVGRNQLHKTSMAGSCYHDRILLQMDGAIFQPHLACTGAASMKELFDILNGTVEYSQKDWPVVLWLLEQIKLELRSRAIGYEGVVKMMVIHLLVLTVRNKCRQQTAGEAQTPMHQKIREITGYLLTHYDARISLDDLAARFYISKSYLCRIFREVTGVTLIEYQNMARIKAAQKLLKETRLPVTEIAARVGFESITYFERVFKKFTGENPLRYRKKYGAIRTGRRD